MKRIISILLLSVIALSTLSSCDNGYTAQDLQEAKQRYFSGNASPSDKRMVEGFYKWKAEQ